LCFFLLTKPYFFAVVSFSSPLLSLFIFPHAQTPCAEHGPSTRAITSSPCCVCFGLNKKTIPPRPIAAPKYGLRAHPRAVTPWDISPFLSISYSCVCLLEKDKKRSKKKYCDPHVVTHYARNPTFFPRVLLHRPGVRACVPRISPCFAPAPIVFPYSRAKKESRDTTKKKRVPAKKGIEEKKNGPREKYADRFGSNASQDRLGHGAPRASPGAPLLFVFSLPFLLFHSFLFLALVISNV
jgi:hypothetical protein